MNINLHPRAVAGLAATFLRWLVDAIYRAIEIVALLVFLATAARSIGRPIPNLPALSPTDLAWLCGAFLAISAGRYLYRKAP